VTVSDASPGQAQDRRAGYDERSIRYAELHSSPISPLLEEVAATTWAETDDPVMITGGLEAGILASLVHATRARHVLEIGTFTGFSALAMAEALPPGGRITTCELNPRHAELARQHVARSPFSDRIELRLGPAIETVRGLEGPFDLVFVDADKGGYADYYEAVLPKLAPHGLIVVDNTLWGGAVADDSDRSEMTRTIAAFNDHVLADPRTDCVLLPVGDGVTLIWRRAQ
jgi:caffeoyl-CoA O-methyltransferase